jgi:uncharacterized protein
MSSSPWLDVVPLALGIPMAAAVATRYRGVRRLVWFGLAAATCAITLDLALVESQTMFAALRVAAHWVFLVLPFGLLLAAIRERRRPRLAAALGVPALAILGIGADAFLLEPHDLQVTRYRIESPNVERRLLIAVIADLQLGEVGEHERAAVRRALDARPDLILFAGDYVHERDPGRYRALIEETSRFLREVGLDAPLGVYAVQGNVEHASWERLFDPLRVTVFAESGSAARGDVAVTGLTLDDSFDPSIRVPRAGRFHVVLGHSPDFSLGEVDADLLVAGHTHGGQVQLPFVGPLFTFSDVPREVAAGGAFPARGGGTLVVSRGVGMERNDAPRMRWRCTPEIVLVEVTPSVARP